MSTMTAAWSARRFGGAGDHHVGVADGLDLLESMSLGERVEAAEDLVEHGDDPGRRFLGRERREVDDVGEQDRDLVVVVGDDAFSALQPVGDRTRQDVEQQGVGLRLGADALPVDEDDEAERDRRRNDEIQRGEQEPARVLALASGSGRTGRWRRPPPRPRRRRRGRAGRLGRRGTAPRRSGTRMIQMRLAAPHDKPPAGIRLTNRTASPTIAIVAISGVSRWLRWNSARAVAERGELDQCEGHEDRSRQRQIRRAR